MHLASKITPCLWFDKEAEAAAKFYVSIFKDSKLGRVSYYGHEGRDIHGGEPGSVLYVEFEINGQPFVAMNGGPLFKFNEAVSFQIYCETQQEIDYYWSRLTEGGQEVECGWLKDKYGLSWQVVPTVLAAMMTDQDRRRSDRVMKALLQMKKFDIAALQQAFAG